MAMFKNLIFLPVCTAFLFISCAGSRSADPAPPEDLIWLTDNTGLMLLPPEAMDGSLDEIQFISATWQDRQFSFNTLLICNDSQLYLLALGEMGQELFELTYTDSGVEFHGAPGTGRIDPRYIILDLQLAYYSAGSLSRKLNSAGLQFSEDQENGVVHRTIRDGEKTIMEVYRDRNEIRIKNHLRAYSYHILRENTDV